MAKKAKVITPIVNPVTINTLNVENANDLTYEIGLGKLIKFVVDGAISEDEINAVFERVSIATVDGCLPTIIYTAYDCLKGMNIGHPCDNENCRKQRSNVFTRAWSKVKGWFKK